MSERRKNRPVGGMRHQVNKQMRGKDSLGKDQLKRMRQEDQHLKSQDLSCDVVDLRNQRLRKTK